MKARYLLALLVGGSAFATVEHDLILKLEHSTGLEGAWSEVAIDGSMMTNGRINAGRVTGEAGFYRLSGELVPVPTPTPSPTPVPAPVVDVVTLAGGQLAASMGLS
jgi:hypothetical protein